MEKRFSTPHDSPFGSDAGDVTEIVALANDLDVQDPAAVVDMAIEIGRHYGRDAALAEVCRAKAFDCRRTTRRPLPIPSPNPTPQPTQ